MSDCLYRGIKSFQASGSQVKRAVIHYRPDETMYVEAKSDRVTGTDSKLCLGNPYTGTIDHELPIIVVFSLKTIVVKSRKSHFFDNLP